MEKLIQDLITDDILNHGTYAAALVEYLSLKGLIDKNDFYRYLDDYAKESLKRKYPDLPLP